MDLRLLLGLCLLNLVLLLALGVVVLRLRGRMRRARKADKVARRQIGQQGLHNRRRDWRQVEALFSLYRTLDRRVELPRTRLGPASPDFLLHIIDCIREGRPKTIVECGSGSSTIVLAHLVRALGIDSHIYAIENYLPSIEKVRRQLREQDLERFVTLITVPLVEKRYDGFASSFRWYDLDPSALPAPIDFLIVDGPHGSVNRYARYPAGPEFLPSLSHGGRVFIDDANRPDEQEMVRLWLKSHPRLGVRNLDAENGCIELFFPDRGVETPAAGQGSVAVG